MPLRREIHRFLWVSAIALLVAMFFRATLPPSIESDVEANLIETAPRDTSVSAARTSQTIGWSRQLMDVPGGARVLFPSAEPVAEITSFEPTQDSEPVLKGIIQSDGGLVAVFLTPESSAYRTLGVGETVGKYRIVAVGADRVLMRSPSGDEFFHLRGPGEHP